MKKAFNKKNSINHVKQIIKFYSIEIYLILDDLSNCSLVS